MIGEIARTNLILWVVFSLGSLLLGDRRIFLGVLMGGGIISLNFWLMRRIWEKGLLEGRSPRGLGLRYALKFLGLMGAVAGVALFLRKWVDMVAFLVGLLTIFLAICIEGVRAYITGEGGGDVSRGT